MLNPFTHHRLLFHAEQAPEVEIKVKPNHTKEECDDDDREDCGQPHGVFLLNEQPAFGKCRERHRCDREPVAVSQPGRIAEIDQLCPDLSH